ncbi:hypothetical protein DVH05_027494 [Phytophthora capsici]|nr:hypothetical protein DVH05_027494 [Phytophthora capsici]
MKRRPKNRNKTKLKGVEASKSSPVVEVVKALAEHRSSIYRLHEAEAALAADKKVGNKFYVQMSTRDALKVRFPALEKRMLAMHLQIQ